jgi:hypothetical protein
MQLRCGPIGAMTYLLKRHSGWSMIAAGFFLVLWSLTSISIAHWMMPQHALYRYNLLTIETAVFFAMPAGIVFIAAGVCWQFAIYAKRWRQGSLPRPDAP